MRLHLVVKPQRLLVHFHWAFLTHISNQTFIETEGFDCLD